MSTLDRVIVAITACVMGLLISAWVHTPPRRVDTPSPRPTDAAALCAEVRGNGSPLTVASLAAAPNVPVELAGAAMAYAQEPTPGALQRLQLACG